MKRVLIIGLLGILILSACNTSTEIETHEPWTRPAAQGGNGAVYMILHNHTDVADELVGASSDVAEAVDIHESKMDDNGVMQMTQLSAIPLDADAEVEFKPGGLHIMLIGLKQDLNFGDQITLTLQFKNRENIILTVPVMDGADMEGHDMP
jgi:copper(I)-binding protein